MVTKVKPRAGLLQLCEEPMHRDLPKDLNADGEAFADLAQKFRDCSTRYPNSSVGSTKMVHREQRCACPQSLFVDCRRVCGIAISWR